MNSENGVCPNCEQEKTLLIDIFPGGIKLVLCLRCWREYIDAMEDAVSDEEEDAEQE